LSKSLSRTTNLDTNHAKKNLEHPSDCKTSNRSHLESWCSFSRRPNKFRRCSLHIFLPCVVYFISNRYMQIQGAISLPSLAKSHEWILVPSDDIDNKTSSILSTHLWNYILSLLLMWIRLVVLLTTRTHVSLLIFFFFKKKNEVLHVFHCLAMMSITWLNNYRFAYYFTVLGNLPHVYTQ